MKPIDLTFPKGAIFSDDRRYRYALWRMWNILPTLQVIGLNPSVANELKDDPTITRLMTRANREGFGGLLMTNLYGFISTDPKVLLTNSDSVGEFNDYYLKQAIAISSRQLCGWGSFAPVKKRAPIVLQMIKEPYCLGINADGQPKHPLYVGYDTPMVKYPERFTCLYDGIHFERCPNNDNGVCRTKYLLVLELMRHPFDGKNEIKYPCG